MQLRAENLWTYIVEGGQARNVLDPATSYLPDGYYFKPMYKRGYSDGRVRFVKFDHASGLFRFPTGLLKNVLDHLESKNWKYSLEDNREFDPAERFVTELADSVKGKTPLYDYQQEAVRAISAAGRGVIQIATGGGKSLVGAATIASFGGRWVWLTHRVNLLYQTHRVLSERLRRPIGMLGDSVSQIEDVTVAMVQTAHNVLAGPTSEAKNFLLSAKGFIGDEIHHVDGGSDQWYGSISSLPAIWRVGLTATPKLDGAGLYLLSMTGPVVYRILSGELIARKKLVPPRIWFHPINTPTIDKKAKWPELYKLGVVFNVERNKAIAQIAKQFASEKKSTLILIKQIQHGNEVREHLDHVGIRHGWIAGSVGQADREAILQRLWDGKLDAVVAVAETLGEGTDLPPLRAIINATGQKGGGDSSEGDSGRVTIQLLGRGLRTSPGKTHCDYVDFADMTHKKLIDASKDRIATLEAEGYASFIKYWRDYEPDKSVALQTIG